MPQSDEEASGVLQLVESGEAHHAPSGVVSNLCCGRKRLAAQEDRSLLASLLSLNFIQNREVGWAPLLPNQGRNIQEKSGSHSYIAVPVLCRTGGPLSFESKSAFPLLSGQAV